MTFPETPKVLWDAVTPEPFQIACLFLSAMNYDRARLAFAIKWWRRSDPDAYLSFRKNWWRYYLLRPAPKAKGSALTL